MPKAYLEETAVLAYRRLVTDGIWGLRIGERAREAINNLLGLSFIPLLLDLGPIWDDHPSNVHLRLNIGENPGGKSA
jgi:hypothetical protein